MNETALVLAIISAALSIALAVIDLWRKIKGR
jgi:hypothetical protein